MRLEAIAIIAASVVISVAALILWTPPPTEIMWLFILVAWILFVVFGLSKWVARWQNLYVARKLIHILSGGIVALLTPYLFSSPTIPLIGGIGVFVLTVFPRLRGDRLDWFQVEGNLGEVWFCVTWTIVVAGLWYIDLNAGIAAALFMSVGDGVTGIVRNLVYGRWSKGLAGTVAMLLVSLPIGWYYRGAAGLLGAVVATLVERWPKIDDNITVPLLSAVVMVLLGDLL